jgi:hypothetical protein
MKTFRFTINALAITIFTFAFVSIAQGQGATRTWVSGVGDDANPCSRTAPCKTFTGAISKTAKDGEIDTLEPGGFGTATITKSITIDGTATGIGHVQNLATNGFIINIIDAADVRKSVMLRGLSVDGNGSGLKGVRIVAALAVFVENCNFTGQNGSPGVGISDERTTGGLLEIKGTSITNNTGAGLSVNPSTGSTQINVHIFNSVFERNATGFFAGSNVRATIFDSVFTQNTVAGISAQATAGGTTDLNVDHCMVSNNVNGFQANTANTIIRVSNTTAINNGTNNAGLAVVIAGGLISSYGNNQTGQVAFPSAPTGSSE